MSGSFPNPLMPKLPAPRSSPYVIEIERLRRGIPLARLLKLAEIAVTTGQLPILDINGSPTGEYTTVSTESRLAQLNRLVDKAMPDRQEAPLLPEDNKLAIVTDVRNLSDEDLENLANEQAAIPALLDEPSAPEAHLGHEGSGDVPSGTGAGGTPAQSSDAGTPAP